VLHAIGEEPAKAQVEPFLELDEATAKDMEHFTHLEGGTKPTREGFQIVYRPVVG
jgi:hypothetical protein